MPIDTSQPLTQTRPIASRMGWALIVSLSLNALFIGGLASALLRHRGEHSGGNAGFGGLGAYVQTLPPARSQAISSRIADKRQENGPLRREVRQVREESLAALAAQPFEKDRFVTAQTRLIEAEHLLRLAQRDMLAEMAGALTPDERRAFIQWRGRGQPHAAGTPGSPPAEKP